MSEHNDIKKSHIEATAPAGDLVSNDEKNQKAMEEFHSDYQKEEEKSDEKILGKFDTQEDLEKAYQELQVKLSKGETNEDSEDESTEDKKDEDETEEDSTEDSSGNEEDSEDDSQTEVKTSVDEAFNFLAEQGEMNDEVIAKFEEVGISKDLIERFTELETFKANAQLDEIFKSVGGEDEYKALMAWAGENLSQEETALFNKAIDEGTHEEMKFAVEGLSARRNKSPKRDKLIKADSLSTVDGGYSSREEMQHDINSDEYANNPAFRDKVMKKMKASNFK